MEPHSAAADLQVIRTLMERSALYRRALAPIMMLAGVMGLAGGVLCVVVPLYMAESLPAAIRGRGTAVFQFLMTVGLLAALLIVLGAVTVLTGMAPVASSTRSYVSGRNSSKLATTSSAPN